MTLPFGIIEFLEWNEEASTLFKTWPVPEKYQTSHPDFIQSQFLSRWCLKKALKKLKIELKWSELELTDHHFLEQAPTVLVSLSHTKGAACAWVCLKSEAKCIGIDLEHTKREISPSIQKKIMNDRDSAFSPLVLWCLKEACFKAVPASGQMALTYDNMIIHQKTFACPSYSGTHYILLKDDYYLALAFLS